MTDEWSQYAGAGFEGHHLNDRDRTLFLLGEFDLDAQLVAIRGVLRQNRKVETEIDEEIKTLEAHIRNYTGDNDEYRFHLEDRWVDALHRTVFQDAAHSMSAAGMLAPFTESLIVSIFHGLQTRWVKDARTMVDTIRGKSSAKKFWDPRYYRDSESWRKAGVAEGTKQLCEVIGLSPYLPGGFVAMLGALMAYRNQMFHNGFEWPMEVRSKFGDMIVAKGWPDGWFERSTTSGDPWIYYLSDDFIEHFLQMIDKMLVGVGRYLNGQVV